MRVIRNALSIHAAHHCAECSYIGYELSHAENFVLRAVLFVLGIVVLIELCLVLCRKENGHV